MQKEIAERNPEKFRYFFLIDNNYPYLCLCPIKSSNMNLFSARNP